MPVMRLLVLSTSLAGSKEWTRSEAAQVEDKKAGSARSCDRLIPRPMGAWGEGAKGIIKKIGQRVRWATGKSRSTVFLIQRLAIDVQRGNVSS